MVLALLAAGCSMATAEIDICDTAAVKEAGGRNCWSQTVLLRMNGQTVRTMLASVGMGFTLDIDVVQERFIHFLLVPAEGVVLLKEYPALLRRGALGRVYADLDYELARAGGIGGTDASIFFDVLLERRSAGYCQVFRMRPPFIGELAACEDGVTGSVGHGPGVVAPKAAGRLICEHVAQETGARCENNGVEVIFNAIQRGAGGQPEYRIVARRTVAAHPGLAEKDASGRVTSVPVEYEQRRYRMDLDGQGRGMLDRTRMLCATDCRMLPAS